MAGECGVVDVDAPETVEELGGGGTEIDGPGVREELVEGREMPGQEEELAAVIAPRTLACPLVSGISSKI